MWNEILKQNKTTYYSWLCEINAAVAHTSGLCRRSFWDTLVADCCKTQLALFLAMKSKTFLTEMASVERERLMMRFYCWFHSLIINPFEWQLDRALFTAILKVDEWKRFLICKIIGNKAIEKNQTHVRIAWRLKLLILIETWPMVFDMSRILCLSSIETEAEESTTGKKKVFCHSGFLVRSWYVSVSSVCPAHLTAAKTFLHFRRSNVAQCTVTWSLLGFICSTNVSADCMPLRILYRQNKVKIGFIAIEKPTLRNAKAQGWTVSMILQPRARCRTGILTEKEGQLWSGIRSKTFTRADCSKWIALYAKTCLKRSESRASTVWFDCTNTTPWTRRYTYVKTFRNTKTKSYHESCRQVVHESLEEVSSTAIHDKRNVTNGRI